MRRFGRAGGGEGCSETWELLCAGFLWLRGAPATWGWRGAPCPGRDWKEDTRREWSPVSAAGLSGPPACLAPRRASLLGCPLHLSHSETTQRLRLRLVGHVWEPRFHRAELGRRGWGRPGEGPEVGWGRELRGGFVAPVVTFTRSPLSSARSPHPAHPCLC